MTRRHRVVLLIAAGSVLSIAGAFVAGCMQSLDPDTAKGGATLSAGDAGASTGSGNANCPSGEVCSNPTSQCTLDSPECFYLCGSPLCALGPSPDDPDAGAPIPSAADVPPIYVGSTDSQIVADGSTTTDPCVQMEAEAVTIRQRSCSPCHEATAGTTKALCGCTLTYIMSDQQLMAGVSPDIPGPDGGNGAYLTPGSPANSLIWVRIANNTMPPPLSSATQILGSEAGAALVYPTVEDVSVLSEWITSCLGDAGANPAEAFGGGLNGSMCFGPCSGDGGTGASAVTTGGGTPVVDAGAGDK